METAQICPSATRSMVTLTLVTAAAVALLIPIQGLWFPLADAVSPLLTTAGLTALAFYYHKRRVASFTLCLKALVALVGFSSLFAMLTYCIAASGRPWADPLLAASDARLGLSAAELIRWVNDRPIVEWGLRLAYFSMIPQTILAIVYFGLKNDQRRLDQLLLRFMLCGFLTMVGFYLWPARGTCASYDLQVPGYYQVILEHLDAIRSGERLLVTWRDAEGLVTFPSFHAVWAVLLTAAFYRSGRLFYPIAALNLLVLVSTISAGLHYFTDVAAGLAICAVVIPATNRWAHDWSENVACSRE